MASEQNFLPCIVVADLPMEQKWISVDGEIREPWTARVKVFSYSEIENMTSGFQRRREEGGFGYVCYGCLAEGRRSKDVAVKVLSKDAPKQSSTEVCYFGPTNALLVVKFRHVHPSPSTFVYIRHRINEINLFLSKQIATFGRFLTRTITNWVLWRTRQPGFSVWVYGWRWPESSTVRWGFFIVICDRVFVAVLYLMIYSIDSFPIDGSCN